MDLLPLDWTAPKSSKAKHLPRISFSIIYTQSLYKSPYILIMFSFSKAQLVGYHEDLKKGGWSFVVCWDKDLI